VLSAPIQRTVRADAVIYPKQQAAIVPKVVAPIKALHVTRGARVKAGQPLIDLESRDLSAAAAESDANFAQADAQYQTAINATLPEEIHKADLDTRAAKDAFDAQQAILDNRQRLLREGAIAQRDVNDAQAATSQARTQYEVAKQRLDDLKSGAHDASI